MIKANKSYKNLSQHELREKKNPSFEVENFNLTQSLEFKMSFNVKKEDSNLSTPKRFLLH